MDLGPHAAFIWAAYGAFTAIVGLLIGWTLFDGRHQAMALAEVERHGLKRRSSSSAATQESGR